LQRVRDRPRNMDVQVQADCLSENAPGSKAKDDGRFSTPLTVFLRDRKLREDLRVNLHLMVEVIRHCRMSFSGRQIGVLSADLIGRPPMGQVVHDDLRHAHSWQPC
jgi:hypothetical protein